MIQSSGSGADPFGPTLGGRRLALNDCSFELGTKERVFVRALPYRTSLTKGPNVGRQAVKTPRPASTRAQMQMLVDVSEVRSQRDVWNSQKQKTYR